MDNPDGEPWEVFPCGVHGLAINRAPDTSGWNITHVRSGLAVAWFPDADPEAVLAAAHALAAVADWTADAASINYPRIGLAVMDAVEQWGGRLYKNEVPRVLDDLPG